MADAFDPETGEILEEAKPADSLNTRYADGSRRPPPSATLADTIRLLNDGDFDKDASAELRKLVATILEHAENGKGTAKGTITIKLDIRMQHGAHVVTPSVKVTAPVAPHLGTLLFADEDGRLSRDRMDQGALFGGVRAVVDNSKRDVRSV